MISFFVPFSLPTSTGQAVCRCLLTCVVSGPKQFLVATVFSLPQCEVVLEFDGGTDITGFSPVFQGLAERSCTIAVGRPINWDPTVGLVIHICSKLCPTVDAICICNTPSSPNSICGPKNSTCCVIHTSWGSMPERFLCPIRVYRTAPQAPCCIFGHNDLVESWRTSWYVTSPLWSNWYN